MNRKINHDASLAVLIDCKCVTFSISLSVNGHLLLDAGLLLAVKLFKGRGNASLKFLLELIKAILQRIPQCKNVLLLCLSIIFLKYACQTTSVLAILLSNKCLCYLNILQRIAAGKRVTTTWETDSENKLHLTWHDWWSCRKIFCNLPYSSRSKYNLPSCKAKCDLFFFKKRKNPKYIFKNCNIPKKQKTQIGHFTFVFVLNHNLSFLASFSASSVVS